MLRRLWLVLRGILTATGAFFFLVTFTPLVPWAAAKLTTGWTETNRGTLILLSADDVTFPGPEPNRAVGLTSYWRAMEAIYIWRQGRFSKLLISGEHSGETIKPLLIANGVPEDAILVEGRSHSTRENALYCQTMLADLPSPYVLLTSDYHTYRASRAFARANVRVETITAPDILKRTTGRVARWQCFWDLSAEYCRVAYYRFKGWI
jgi:uncharacterized SAM-binding protein YcdF (DUF218 family)